MEENKGFETPAVEFHTPEGPKRFSICARVIKEEESFPYRILVHFLKKG